MLAIVTPPLTLVLIETFHNGTPLLQKESKRKSGKTAENELCVVRLACVFRLLPPNFASSARMGTKDYHSPRGRLVFVNSLFILIVVARGHRFMRLVFASYDYLTRTSKEFGNSKFFVTSQPTLEPNLHFHLRFNADENAYKPIFQLRLR